MNVEIWKTTPKRRFQRSDTGVTQSGHINPSVWTTVDEPRLRLETLDKSIPTMGLTP